MSTVHLPPWLGWQTANLADTGLAGPNAACNLVHAFCDFLAMNGLVADRVLCCAASAVGDCQDLTGSRARHNGGAISGKSSGAACACTTVAAVV